MEREYKIIYYDPETVGRKMIRKVKEGLLSNQEKEYLYIELTNHFNYLPPDIQEKFMIANIMSNKFVRFDSNGKK